ncbi:CGNR zinc finger domain-containing protein [Kribbella alba]|uniref:CGNR zinc finger domain-containing protein n=1 Tax=Kribbella alba TaxID=190197 RepID=UPI003CD0B49E
MGSAPGTCGRRSETPAGAAESAHRPAESPNRGPRAPQPQRKENRSRPCGTTRNAGLFLIDRSRANGRRWRWMAICGNRLEASSAAQAVVQSLTTAGSGTR